MLLSTQIGIAGLGSVSSAAASGIAAQPQMAGLVDHAAASFMMASPEALRFAKEALPKNRLLIRSQAATFEEIQRRLTGASAKDRGSSNSADAVAGAVLVGAVVAVVAGARAVTVASAGAAVAVVLQPTLARFLDRPISLISLGINSRTLREVKSFLSDSTTIQQFFVEHPDVYATFLRETVSQTFRQKEGEARGRIDALTAKKMEVERKWVDQERTISVSDILSGDKETLLTEVEMAAREALKKLDEAIETEGEFATAVNLFIEEILEMEGAIGREITAQNVYEGARQFVAFAEEVDGAVAKAESQRLAAVIDLAAYWGRLREMGDDVAFRLQGTLAVSQALLEPPPSPFSLPREERVRARVSY